MTTIVQSINGLVDISAFPMPLRGSTFYDGFSFDYAIHNLFLWWNIFVELLMKIEPVIRVYNVILKNNP